MKWRALFLHLTVHGRHKRTWAKSIIAYECLHGLMALYLLRQCVSASVLIIRSWQNGICQLWWRWDFSLRSAFVFCTRSIDVDSFVLDLVFSASLPFCFHYASLTTSSVVRLYGLIKTNSLSQHENFNLTFAFRDAFLSYPIVVYPRPCISHYIYHSTLIYICLIDPILNYSVKIRLLKHQWREKPKKNSNFLHWFWNFKKREENKLDATI